MSQTQQPLSVYVDGQGEQTILMIHGWPDTYRVWDEQVAALSPHYRCVRVTLPNFDQQGARHAYRFGDVVAMINQVVDEVSPNKPVILLIHDWGCVFGYQFYRQYPHKVSHLISIDIGDALSKDYLKSLKAYQALMIVSYQLNLAAAWFLPEAIGTPLTKLVAKALQQPTPAEPVHRGMNYPYFQTWFKPISDPVKPFSIVPDCPMLYVYAKHKPVMFQSKQWLARVAAQQSNQVVAMEAGHWLMREQAPAFNSLVLNWLQSSQR